MLSEKQQEFFDLIGIQPEQVFKDSAFSTLYKFVENGDEGVALMYKGEDGWDFINYPWGIDTFINAFDRLEIVKPASILTDEEQEYLENTVRPFKDKIISITLFEREREDDCSSIQILYTLNDIDKDNAEYWRSFHPPLIDCMYKFEDMKPSRCYSLEELEMFKDCKITLSDFHNQENRYAINCTTKEQAKQLMKAFNKRGYKWSSGEAYSEDTTYFGEYALDTSCYTNKGEYANVDWCERHNITIFDFKEVDYNN